MTYRDRTTGQYPLSVAVIRTRVNTAFGSDPTPAILDEANVDAVEATPAPTPGPNQTVREGDPTEQNGKWVQTWVVENAPRPSYFTFKGDIWRRVTEDEARELDEDLTALPVRLRRLWDDSAQINHDDEYGQILIQTMTDRWGAERVAIVMAPSGVV